MKKFLNKVFTPQFCEDFLSGIDSYLKAEDV